MLIKRPEFYAKNSKGRRAASLFLLSLLSPNGSLIAFRARLSGSSLRIIPLRSQCFLFDKFRELVRSGCDGCEGETRGFRGYGSEGSRQFQSRSERSKSEILCCLDRFFGSRCFMVALRLAI